MPYIINKYVFHLYLISQINEYNGITFINVKVLI